MDESSVSPLRQLVDVKLGGGLRERVMQLYISEGKGWRLTAQAITAETGVSVSYEVLRSWYGEEPEFKAAAVGRVAS